MCGYMGKEMVDLSRTIAGLEHELEEVMRDAVRFEQTHLLPGAAAAARAALVRTGDLRASVVFSRVYEKITEALSEVAEEVY